VAGSAELGRQAANIGVAAIRFRIGKLGLAFALLGTGATVSIGSAFAMLGTGGTGGTALTWLGDLIGRLLIFIAVVVAARYCRGFGSMIVIALGALAIVCNSSYRFQYWIYKVLIVLSGGWPQGIE